METRKAVALAEAEVEEELIMFLINKAQLGLKDFQELSLAYKRLAKCSEGNSLSERMYGFLCEAYNGACTSSAMRAQLLYFYPIAEQATEMNVLFFGRLQHLRQLVIFISNGQYSRIHPRFVFNEQFNEIRALLAPKVTKPVSKPTPASSDQQGQSYVLSASKSGQFAYPNDGNGQDQDAVVPEPKTKKARKVTFN
jgi:hypothetical protein